jgi:hypothetical protein
VAQCQRQAKTKAALTGQSFFTVSVSSPFTRLAASSNCATEA